MTASLAWLTDLRPAFGADLDSIIEVDSGDDTPPFDYGADLPAARRIAIASGDESWRATLASELKRTRWQTCLLNVLATRPRSLRGEVDGKLVSAAQSLLAAPTH